MQQADVSRPMLITKSKFHLGMKCLIIITLFEDSPRTYHAGYFHFSYCWKDITRRASLKARPMKKNSQFADLPAAYEKQNNEIHYWECTWTEDNAKVPGSFNIARYSSFDRKPYKIASLSKERTPSRLRNSSIKSLSSFTRTGGCLLL